jgi:hypothetical protein
MPLVNDAQVPFVKSSVRTCCFSSVILANVWLASSPTMSRSVALKLVVVFRSPVASSLWLFEIVVL